MNKVRLFRILGCFHVSACGLAAATLLGSAILGSQALAQDFISLENDQIQDVVTRDPAGFWTPEELSRAQLQEMLVPSVGLQELVDEAAVQLEGLALGTEAKDGFNIGEATEVEPDLEDRLSPIPVSRPNPCPPVSSRRISVTS